LGAGIGVFAESVKHTCKVASNEMKQARKNLLKGLLRYCETVRKSPDHDVALVAAEFAADFARQLREPSPRSKSVTTPHAITTVEV
jgi:hypothetical protein